MNEFLCHTEFTSFYINDGLCVNFHFYIDLYYPAVSSFLFFPFLLCPPLFSLLSSSLFSYFLRSFSICTIYLPTKSMHFLVWFLFALFPVTLSYKYFLIFDLVINLFFSYLRPIFLFFFNKFLTFFQTFFLKV